MKLIHPGLEGCLSPRPLPDSPVSAVSVSVSVPVSVPLYPSRYPHPLLSCHSHHASHAHPNYGPYLPFRMPPDSPIPSGLRNYLTNAYSGMLWPGYSAVKQTVRMQSVSPYYSARNGVVDTYVNTKTRDLLLAVSQATSSVLPGVFFYCPYSP